MELLQVAGIFISISISLSEVFGLDLVTFFSFSPFCSSWTSSCAESWKATWSLLSDWRSQGKSESSFGTWVGRDDNANSDIVGKGHEENCDFPVESIIRECYAEFCPTIASCWLTGMECIWSSLVFAMIFKLTATDGISEKISRPGWSSSFNQEMIREGFIKNIKK